MIKLKPCPFCGGAADNPTAMKYTEDFTDTDDFMINCTNCGASVRLFYHTPAQAIEAWNTRDSLVAAEAREEGIEEAVDVAIKLAYDVMGATLGLARSYSDRLIETIKRLKEEGCHITE